MDFHYVGSYLDPPGLQNRMLITSVGVFRLKVDNEGKIIVQLPQNSEELGKVVQKMSENMPDTFESFKVTEEFFEIEVKAKPND